MKISQFSFSFKSSRRKTNHHPPIKRPFSVLVLQSVPAPLLVVQRSAIFHATHGTSALGRVDRELRVAEKRPFSVLSPSLLTLEAPDDARRDSSRGSSNPSARIIVEGRLLARPTTPHPPFIPIGHFCRPHSSTGHLSNEKLNKL